MKNSQKGFIVPLLLTIIAILIVGGGAYAYMQNKQTNQPAVVSPFVQQTVPTATTQTPVVTNTTTSTKPSITVLSPNGGEILQWGKNFDIKWNCPVEKIGESFDIHISNGNGTRALIGSVVKCSVGKYSWKVGDLTPYSYGETIILGNSSKIELRNIAGAASLIDESDNYFTIVN